METYGDVFDAFYPLIGDSITAGTFVNSTQAYALANKAVRNLADESRCIDVITALTWTASSSTWVPTSGADYDFVSLWRVEVDDEKVLPITKDELRRRDREWQQRTGTPYLYYLDEEARDAAGNMTIGLYPTPDANVTVRFYAAINGYRGNNTTEYIQLPKWAVPGVLYSMLADFYRMPGVRRNMQASKFYKALYDDVKARLVQESNARLPKDRCVGGAKKQDLVTDKYRGDISTIS